MAANLCHGCKRIAEVAYIEGGTERPFCASCAARQPLTSDERALILLVDPNSPYAPQFHDGDRVEARGGAIVFDGVGTIAGMSMSLEHGATAIYPSFLVRFDKKAYPEVPDETWYPEACLTRIETS